MATVEQYEWFEPDGHEYTGYVEVVVSGRRLASEVILEDRNAVIAIEDESLWNDAWGQLSA
ncbi:MAG: hypothetical protein KF810_22995 [Rhizobiaceae bacterium]|nr:hypothetical protein [Rhizobiaceae bacterium]